MLIVDNAATAARVKDRCVALQRVARKYGIAPMSLNKFVNGKFFGKSGHGVVGKMEAALIEMDLLVYTVAEDDSEVNAN